MAIFKFSRQWTRESVAVLASISLLLVVPSLPLGASTTNTTGTAAGECSGSRDLALIGGKILTMAEPAFVSALLIRDGRIVRTGSAKRADYTPCTQIIDLKGRTAIPGLIDGHIHFVTWGYRPGRDVRLDLADSIPGLEHAVQERLRGLSSHDWLTAVGGWSRTQFVEGRLPSRAELDVAAPTNPLFIWERDGQDAVVNTAAAQFFEKQGIEVSSEGVIPAAAGKAAIAYSLLAHRFTDPRRGTREALEHLAALGVTTVSDMGVNAAPEGARPPTKSWHSGHVDVFTAYDPVLAIARADGLTARVRINFMDTPDGPPHDAQRLKYVFPMFGSDMLKTLCMGEFITPAPAQYAAAALAVAERGGWCHEQHVMGLEEIRKFIGIWEGINATSPLVDRRWRLAHIFGIDADALKRLRALDAGVDIAAMLYSPGNPLPGPSREINYRSILASGVPVSGVSDGPNYMPINPWVHMSLMISGKDSQGRRVVAPSETLSRLEALSLYTSRSGWFMRDDRLGKLRPGAFGDVVILNKDLLMVPDDQIREIHAAVTVVDGRVVYTAPFKRRGSP